MRPYNLTAQEVLSAFEGKMLSIAANPSERRTRGSNDHLRAQAPFGDGSRFYGRETWCVLAGFDGDPDVVCYFADDGARAMRFIQGKEVLAEDAGCPASYMRDEANDPWQSADSMPLRYSRILFQTGKPRLEVIRHENVWVADVKVKLR